MIRDSVKASGKSSIKRSLIMSRRPTVAAIISALSLFATDAATAQNVKNQFIGTWTLISIRYVRPDGAAVEPFGANVAGMLVFDAERFATQAIAANLPKFASNNRMLGTPEEYKAISHGVVSYFGTYTVNEAARVLTLHIERSSFPNWSGTDQERKFEFVGNELRYTAAHSTANPAEAAQLIWKRAK